MFFDIFLKNQEFLFYLIGVMICVGIIKDKNLFSGLYCYLFKKIHYKKILIVIISALSGILPVPGRVVVSAGMLDTLAPKRKKSREKFGIVDYLSTHHYYLWSPLEKTVIIPMSVLGLSYLSFLKYTLPLLVISILVLVVYIIFFLDEKDIVIRQEQKNRPVFFFRNIFPLIVSLGLLIANFEPGIVFTALALYFILITKTYSFIKLNSYIKYGLVATLFIIIATSNFLLLHSDKFINLVSTNQSKILVCLIVFVVSFLLGSSSKFSSMVSVVTVALGLQYFQLLMTIAFSGYLLSPFHKCVAIGKMYFKTPLLNYYLVITIWCLLMITYSLVRLLIV